MFPVYNLKTRKSSDPNVTERLRGLPKLPSRGGREMGWSILETNWQGLEEGAGISCAHP